MGAALDRRVGDLEAAAFRARGEQADIQQRLDHLTSAIGDLSQEGRAVALDVREIRAELGELTAKVDALTEQVTAGFAAVMATLEGK